MDGLLLRGVMDEFQRNMIHDECILLPNLNETILLGCINGIGLDKKKGYRWFKPFWSLGLDCFRSNK